MFHAAANALRLPAADCVFIDDRFGNILRAMACGMVGVYYPGESPLGVSYLSRLLTQMGILS